MCIALAVLRDCYGGEDKAQESFGFPSLAGTATEKSAVVTQRQVPMVQKVQEKLYHFNVHSTTAGVQLCLKLGVAEVAGNRRNREGYSGAVH